MRLPTDLVLILLFLVLLILCVVAWKHSKQQRTIFEPMWASLLFFLLALMALGCGNPWIGFPCLFFALLGEDKCRTWEMMMHNLIRRGFQHIPRPKTGA